jgi:hypothetical protein
MLKFAENLGTSVKINVDNKVRFRYLDVRRLRLFEFPYVELRLNPIHNPHFCIIHSGKSEFLSIQYFLVQSLPLLLNYSYAG